jgi:hypothetical protein
MKRLMLDYAFKFVDRVIFLVGTTNFRSQKAMNKIWRNSYRAACPEKPARESLRIRHLRDQKSGRNSVIVIFRNL